MRKREIVALANASSKKYLVEDELLEEIISQSYFFKDIDSFRNYLLHYCQCKIDLWSSSYSIKHDK